MSEVSSIEDVLSGKPVEAKPETTPETPSEKSQRERDEQGRFKAKGEVTPEPVAQATETPAAAPPAAATETKPEPTDERVPTGALIAERKKRQEAERRAEELERRWQQMQQPRPPDPYTDPDGHRQFVQQQEVVVNARVDASFEAAKAAIPDFEGVMQHWDELVAQNPMLYQQAIQHNAPAYWAYQHVKNHLAMQEIGDPKTYREKLKAELLAELQKQQPQARQTPATPQPSLASAPASGIKSEAAWAGPSSMRDILKR